MTDATGAAIRRRRGGAWFALSVVAALLAVPAPAGAGPSAAEAIELATDHARLEVIASNGSERLPLAVPVVEEATDFSAFSETIDTRDDSSSDRASEAQASQNTTVDDSEGRLKVSSSGSADASGFDQEPGVGDGPNAEAFSGLEVTFEVTDTSTQFLLNAIVSAETDGANDGCTTVTVESPGGEVFEVAAPSGCGGPSGLSIADKGTLGPGAYTLSVVAVGEVLDPGADGSIASASFALTLFVGDCTIVGTGGDDNLTGTSGDDVICGLGGRDMLRGGGGDDVIYGDSGDDRIDGGPGDDQIFGGRGNDDALYGRAGNDLILGEGGRDGIAGGVGNDVLDGGDGKDLIYGDEQEGCDGALSDPGLDDDDILGGGGNDRIRGCQGFDKIHGDAGDDEIDGNTGNDVLLGDAGSDKLRGQGGSDTLTGGPRKDVLLGGQANDVTLARDGVSDEIGGGPGSNDQAQVDEDIDTVTGVEVFLA
jgi:Ca2+-binding RTX toxin-like protein